MSNIFRKNQLVLHYGNLCEIDNLFLNKNNKRCCDLLYEDGTEVSVPTSELYPYIGSMCLTQFRKRRKSNLFKNRIYKNILTLVFFILITFTLNYFNIFNLSNFIN